MDSGEAILHVDIAISESRKIQFTRLLIFFCSRIFCVLWRLRIITDHLVYYLKRRNFGGSTNLPNST